MTSLCNHGSYSTAISVKCKRSADADADVLAKAFRNGEPYLDDGNVLLIIKQTHLQVYHNVLAALPPVFTKISSTSQSTIRDWCRVIESDDSAEPFQHKVTISISFQCKDFDFDFLCCSYRPVEITLLPMEVVTAYLWLDTKYRMTTFRTDAVDRLSILPWGYYGCCYYFTFSELCQPESLSQLALSHKDLQICMMG